jgi:hypothetical protein
MTMTTDGCLTIGELCARWHIDRRTLEKLITDGGLAYIHYPPPVHVRRFPLSVVLDYEQRYFKSTASAR